VGSWEPLTAILNSECEFHYSTEAEEYRRKLVGIQSGDFFVPNGWIRGKVK
jgi:hypothetical protein